MTPHSTDISVNARYDALPGLMAEISRQAKLLDLPEAEGLRLQMVVEELFINTVTHGHGGDSLHTVRLALRRKDGHIVLHYVDQAPPFDLSKIRPKFASTAEIGGLGLGLIHGMSKTIRYARQDECNFVEIDF